tara:strand:- start:486 stop:629 length:144 start_codon:yes stop_codon:yes gene_type:complete
MKPYFAAKSTKVASWRHFLFKKIIISFSLFLKQKCHQLATWEDFAAK